MPRVDKQFDAMICWLGETPLDKNRKYLLRHTTREAKMMVSGIGYRLDINTLAQNTADQLATNDIARISFRLAQPICADRYEENRATGAFIVIDESTNNTVGAGMII